MITRPLVPTSDGPDDDALRARIVRRLARFGAGPAASFRDACTLMEGDTALACDAVLVGCLVRELEAAVHAALLQSPALWSPGQRERKPATSAGAAHGRIGAVRQALGLLTQALGALVRALFLPTGGRAPLRRETSAPAAVAHGLQVRAVLDSLGIAHDSAAGKTWLAYADAGQLAPPSPGPGAPPPVDKELRRCFWRLVAMLDVVLERHEARYLASVDRLDALARAGRPGDEHASELLQCFPQDPVTLGRFFSRLRSPEWIRPLRNNAFFAQPPAPVGGNGSCWAPDWPALTYLVRAAGQDPALAAEVAADIPVTTNRLVKTGLVDLALAVPAAHSVKLLPRITDDLSGPQAEPYGQVRAERLCALVVHLAEGDRPEAALGLARTLWGFRGSREDDREEGVPRAAGGLRTRIGPSAYAQSLQRCLPPLVDAGGPAVLDAMADVLDDAITRTASPAMIESRQDLSTFWRPALDGRPADTDVDPKTALVSAVRDAAGQLVRDGRVDVPDALRRLGSRDWPIFRRLALHLLRQFGAACPEEVARRLTEPAAIGDPCTEREFLLLAHDHFTALGWQDKQRVLRLIDQGPDTGRWVASYAAHVGHEPSHDKIQRWSAEWTRDRLGALEAALPPRERDSYRSLVQLVGEPAPVGEAQARRFMSDLPAPTGATGLAGWSIDRVIDVLRTRPPAAAAVLPAPEPALEPAAAADATSTGQRAAREQAPAPGEEPAAAQAHATVFDLAQDLRGAVRGSPLRYSAAAGRFSGLQEPYLAQFLGGLNDAAASGADLDWDAVLPLCRSVSGAGAPQPGLQAARGAGRASRREMLRLLGTALGRVPAVIPIGTREEAWQIIHACLSSNDPAAGDGRIADGARATASAQALTAAISYGTWVRRHDRGADIAEVFSVLDRHLDTDTGPSLVVLAGYGTEFHRLAHLDGGWAASAAPRIFPSGDAARERWEAAWDAYLDPVLPISPAACALLTAQYQVAVDRLGTATGERASARDVRLGRHLITRYLAGELTDGDDQLINGFYERAPAAVCGEVAKYIGWKLLTPGTATGAGALSRLSRLWEQRLAVASPSADRAEIVRFGEWFASGRFDDDWSLRQLARVITLTGDARPNTLVLRRLAEISPARTQACLDIAHEWLRQLPDDAWLFSAREEYLRRILQAGLSSQDPRTTAAAEEIIDAATYRGHTRFRDLVPDGTD